MFQMGQNFTNACWKNSSWVHHLASWARTSQVNDFSFPCVLLGQTFCLVESVTTFYFDHSPKISLQHNIGHRKDLEDPPTHESRDLSENGFLCEGCITAWISSH